MKTHISMILDSPNKGLQRRQFPNKFLLALQNVSSFHLQTFINKNLRLGKVIIILSNYCSSYGAKNVKLCS